MVLCERICAFVEGMPSVPFDMTPCHAGRIELDEGFPEIAIFYGGFVARLPVVALPAMHPFGDAVDDILTIAEYGNCAFRRCVLQASDDGSQLHPVVGGVVARPAVFVMRTGDDDDGRPATTTRVARTRAIRDNINGIHVAP